MDETREEDSYSSEANRLVDSVIELAVKQLEQEQLLAHNLANSTPVATQQTDEEEYEVKNIQWLTIDEFSVQRANDKINEFLKTWEYEGSWLQCTDFLGEEDFEFDKRFRFRVRWSIPTRRKPIPRATASVYFTFQVSKIKPKNFPIQVYYVFETNRLVHRPGFSRFREQWLKDIIENKVIMLENVAF